jgi:hypothetical protein
LSGISKFAEGDDFVNSNINEKAQSKFESNLSECSYLLRKITYMNLFLISFREPMLKYKLPVAANEYCRGFKILMISATELASVFYSDKHIRSTFAKLSIQQGANNC